MQRFFAWQKKGKTAVFVVLL